MSSASTAALIANALLLASFIPLMSKLKWRMITERDRSPVVIHDPCRDISLASQLYALAAAGIRFHGSVLSSPRKYLTTAYQVLEKALRKVGAPRTGMTRAQVYSVISAFLTNLRIQSGLIQGLALAAALACVFLLIFGSDGYTPLFRGGNGWRVLEMIPFFLATGVALSVHAYIEGAGRWSRDPRAVVRTFGGALEAFSMLPQALLPLHDGSSNGKASLATIAHFGLKSAAIIVPTVSWVVQKAYPMLMADDPTAMLDKILRQTSSSDGTIAGLFAFISACFFAVSLWRVTTSRRWMLAIIVAALATIIQVTGEAGAPPALGPDALVQVREGSILLQVMVGGFLFIAGGFSYIQAFYAVAFAVMFSAGLLPTSLDEAVRRIKARFGDWQHMLGRVATLFQGGK